MKPKDKLSKNEISVGFTENAAQIVRADARYEDFVGSNHSREIFLNCSSTCGRCM